MPNPTHVVRVASTSSRISLQHKPATSLMPRDSSDRPQGRDPEQRNQRRRAHTGPVAPPGAPFFLDNLVTCTTTPGGASSSTRGLQLGSYGAPATNILSAALATLSLLPHSYHIIFGSPCRLLVHFPSKT